jgi:hypothetical protein
MIGNEVVINDNGSSQIESAKPQHLIADRAAQYFTRR